MWSWLKRVGRRYRPSFNLAGSATFDSDPTRKLRQRPYLERLEDRTAPAISAVSSAAPNLYSDTAAGNVTGPASVSKDGRYVVYTDTAANLAPGQTMNSKTVSDVFLYDRSTGITTLVSHAADSSTTTADGTSKNAVISADGNWVAYVSNSDNLVRGEALANDTYTLTTQGYSGGTFALTYAGNTATLDYNASATDVENALVGLPGVNSTSNVFVGGGSGTPFTITFTGALANGASSALTANGSGLTGVGSFVFLGGHNEFLCDQYNVYLYSVKDRTNTLVSHVASDQGSGYQITASDGTSGILTGADVSQTGLASQTTSVSISGDGGYVTYVSTGAHLLNGQQQGSVNITKPPLVTRANVFVYDRSSDTNYLVSREDSSPANGDGNPNTPGDGTAEVAVIDQNGDTIAFTDWSTNLVNGQTISSNYNNHHQGETQQFFVAKLSGTTWASIAMALASHDLSGASSESIIKTNAPLDYPAPVLTPDGHWMVYLTDNAIVQDPTSGNFAGQGDNYYLYDTTNPNSLSNNTLITHTPGNSSQVGNAGADGFTTTTAPSAAISDNGQYVAFYSAATNYFSTATPAGYNAFVYNATNGGLALITQESIPTSSIPATPYPPLTVSMSGDGRLVAYIGFAFPDVSAATRPAYTLAGSNGLDALLYDQGPDPGTSIPAHTLLSHDYKLSTVTGTAEAYSPVINEDGSTVLYLDDSDNLLPFPAQDLNAALPATGTDLYAYTLTTSSFTPVIGNAQTNSAPVGTNATVTLRDPSLPAKIGNGLSDLSPVHAVSSDGRFVVFASDAPNLVTNEVDTDLTQNVYLYDNATGTTTLLSHALAGTSTTGNGQSTNAVISADGKTIVFYSYATNLVGGVTSGTVQLYLYDNNPNSGTYKLLKLLTHTSGSTTTGSDATAPVNPHGMAGFSTLLYSTPFLSGQVNGLAVPSISDDGHYIAYLSNATNLVSGSSGSHVNAFLYDNNPIDSSLYGKNTLVSSGISSGTKVAANGDASTVAISGDGGIVAFTDAASNLLPASISNNGQDELYAWSRTANLLKLASHGSSDTNNGPPTAATITAVAPGGPLPASLDYSGNVVAYYMGATDLVANQSGGVSPYNVFVYVDNAIGSANIGTNYLVSSSGGSSSQAGNDPTNANQFEGSGPVVSSDGSLVAYANNSTDIVSGDFSAMNGQDNVYLYNQTTKSNALISRSSDSATTPDANGGTAPSLSSDGRYISYIDLSLGNTADVNCTYTSTANVRLYDSQNATGQPGVVGYAFDPTTMGAVKTTLAPTAAVSGINGPVVVWDGPAAGNVAFDLNSNVDVFIEMPSAPTSINLVPASSVPPSTATPSGTTIATVEAAPTTQAYTYTLVPPASGTNDNDLFLLTTAGVLTSNTTFNVTTATTYTITVKAANTANTNLSLTQNLTITVYPQIQGIVIKEATPPPTTVSPANTIVGTLATFDPNPSQSFTYALSGTNANLFTLINGNQLEMVNPIATAGLVTVGVQVTDTLGLTLTQDVTFLIYRPINGIILNETTPPPTTATPANTIVGTLLTDDPNSNNPFTYALTGPNNNLFTLTNGDQLEMTNPITTAGPVTVGVQVTDALGLTLTQNVTVTIYQPITNITFAEATPPPTTASPANSVVGTLTNDDQNTGQSFTYVTTGSNSSLFTITNGNQLTLVNPIATAGTITVGIQVTDTLKLTYTQDVTVTIYQPITSITLTEVTPPPTTASPANTVVGTLTNNDQNTGQSFTYVTTGPNSSLFTITNGNQLTLVNPIATAGTITVGIQVTDTLKLTYTQDVTVTIYQPITSITLTEAIPPPTTASPANTVVGTLTNNDQNDGQSFTYITTGSNSALFTITNGNQLALVNPIATAATITVGIQVTDTLKLTYTQDVTVTIYQPTTGITLTEATPPPTTASPANTVVGTLTNNDQNAGQSFTYVTTGANSALFSVINGNQLVLVNPIATAGTITVGIQVTDTLKLTYTQDVTVTIYQPITSITLTEVIPPPTTASPANTVVGTLTNNDQNTGQSFTYVTTGANSTLFTITNGNQLALVNPIATAGTITVGIQVTDTLKLTCTRDVTVTIYQPITSITLTEATPPPTTASAANAVVGKLTNDDQNDGQSFTYITTGPNSALFTITNGNQLMLANPIATAGTITVGIQVTDTLKLTYTQDVTVTIYQPITNLKLNSGATPISTASASGTIVGTLTATDPNAGQTLSYQLTGANANLFSVDSSGVITTAATFATAGQVAVTVVVTDTLHLTLTQDITIDVYAPITDLTLSSTLVKAAEPVGTPVGTLTTSDPNANQTFTYTLTGANASLFALSGSTLLTNTVFAVGTETLYSLGVHVVDTAKLAFDQTFTITVNPAPPTDITLSNNRIGNGNSVGTKVGVLATADPNANQSFTYQLLNDTNEFAISGNVLQTNTVFEVDSATTYDVQVQTMDTLGLTFTRTLQVTVDPAIPPITAIMYVNAAWIGTPLGANPDTTGGPPLIFGPGGNAFATIQEATTAVSPGGTIVIYGGTYSGGIDSTNAATVQLAGDVTIDTGGADASFSAALTGLTVGQQSLTIKAAGGNVTFGGPVGTTPLADLTIDGAASAIFDSSVDLAGDLTETGGTATTIFNGGTIGGSLSVTAGSITLNSGMLQANMVTLDASGAIHIPALTSLKANGPVLIDCGFNNSAGGSVALAGAVTGSTVTVLGGPGDDTFTVDQVAGPTTLDGSGGSDQLNVDLSGYTAAQTVYVTSQAVSSSVLVDPLFYQDTGGTFGGGINVMTGSGNDTVYLQSTHGGTPTHVNTGAGNDTFSVGSSPNLAASNLNGLAGPLTIDGGAGVNALAASENATTVPDTVWITANAIGLHNVANAIWYKATGGNFGGGVVFVGGQGTSAYVIQSTLPGVPTTVYAHGGNSTFNVDVTSTSDYSALTLDGGGGQSMLGVIDQSGSAIMSIIAYTPSSGEVVVKYDPGDTSIAIYQNMAAVFGSVDPGTSLIRALFQAELGYSAPADAVNYWLGVLYTSGPQAVVDGIDRSQAALTRVVSGWYKTYLDRAPVNGEEQGQVQRLMAGESEESVLASLLSSDEYYGLGGGTDTGFVQRLFAQLLGRSATADEVAAYVNTLMPQVGQKGAAWLILTSPDYRRVAVVADYAELLHITLKSQADMDYWALSNLSLLGIREHLELTPQFLAAQP